MKLIDILVRELPKRGGWPIESNGCRQFPDGEVCFSNVGKKPDFYTECATDVDLVWRKTVTPHVSREQYKAALAAKNDGWIEWDGGKHPPVSTNTVVDVKFEKGYVQSGYPAGWYSWGHVWQDSNIIAYRLHKPRESDLNESIEHDAAPVWSGEGLPPVGCKCEYLDRNNGWYPVTIKYASNQIVVICGMTNILGDKQETEIAKDVQLDKPQFRPIRNESERKRKEAIEEMIKIATIYTTKSLGLDLALNSIYSAIAAGEITGVKLED